MIPAIALALFAALPHPQAASQPRVSGTGTAYLSCTFWTGKNWTNPESRSAKTVVMQSSKGFRAYAEVQVEVKDGSCENTTRLEIASGRDEKFKLVYSVTKGGNGIRLIGWSPDGEKLLADVTSWEYETDGGFGRVALIYDASTRSAKEIPELEKALLKHFGSGCEFEQELQSWQTNDKVILSVSKPPEDNSYEQKFCVQKPRLFLFDLQNKTLEQYQRRNPQTN